MKLNVCLLNDSFPPLIDGVANTVVNYAENIHNKLGQCTVVTPKYPNTEDNFHFPVYRYPSLNAEKAVGYRAGMPFGARTLTALEKKNFQILHTHCPMASGLLARTLRERVDAPLIFTYHTKFDIEIAKILSSEHLQNLVKKLVVNTINACDEVWVVSRGAGENLRSMGYRGDFIVMENGVDMPRQTVPADKCAALRDELHIPQNIPVFLFVGRCMWYKGFRIALDALARLKQAGKPFCYVVVGDSNELNEIKAYADELGLTDSCRFVGAVTDRQKLRVFFGMADLFLFPSTFDTNGLVVREAAAAGLGSLMIEGSCAAEGVTHMRNGVLTAENADAVLKELAWMCDDLPRVREIGAHAQQELYISWSDAVAKAYARYELLYERMRRGELVRKDTRGDAWFELVAECGAGLTKVSRLPRAVRSKAIATYERFRTRGNE